MTTAIKERPILFSGRMVLAILDGRKTQTRRIAKLPDDSYSDDVVRVVDTITLESFWRFSFSGGGACQSHDIDCPYGHPGDRLWVRESAYICPPGWADPADCNCRDDEGRSRNVAWIAGAHGDPARIAEGDYKLRKTPSIHMPRWASRITLEVTGVRVERLQRISHEDALLEGFRRIADFHVSWDSINGRRPGCSWRDNPWVWAIDFRRLAEPPR